MAVYLLLGDDDERKARGVEKLRQDRQADSFDASDASPEEVVSACNSYSLFGDGAFVVLRNLDAWNAAQKAKVVDYMTNPSPETDLVLLGTKLGSREKLLAAVKKSGEVHNLEQPTGKALVRWVVGYAKKLGLELPEDVAQSLTDRCSGEKTRIAREVEKLSLYVVDRPATVGDVADLAPPDVQGNIFAFVDALSAGKRGEAMKLLEDLLATGEPPLRATFMIRRQFHHLARARAMFEDGAPQKQVASELKIPPFVARKLDELGRRVSEQDTELALEYILSLESGLKGGSNLGDKFQMELCVMKLSN